MITMKESDNTMELMSDVWQELAVQRGAVVKDMIGSGMASGCPLPPGQTPESMGKLVESVISGSMATVLARARGAHPEDNVQLTVLIMSIRSMTEEMRAVQDALMNTVPPEVLMKLLEEIAGQVLSSKR